MAVNAYMVKIYVTLVRNNRRSLDSIEDEEMRAAVAAKIEEEDMKAAKN